MRILPQKTLSNNDSRSNTAADVLRSMVARSNGGIIMMTPGLAARILEECNFPKQRALNRVRVKERSHAIQNGYWMPGHAITFAELPDGTLWLVDGQHRMTAISEHDDPVPVTVRIVAVENETEAGAFYAGFDMRKSVRTSTQIIDAVGVADAIGLPRKMATAVFNAAPILLNNLEPVSGTENTRKFPHLFMQQNRMEVISEWAEEALKYNAIVMKSRAALRSKLYGAGIVAVALYTLRHQPALAAEFWTGVAENDGLRKNDPRQTLITDLLTRNLQTGNVRQRVQQPVLAWNAWCQKRDLKIIKCIVDAPIIVYGTPLNGRKDK